MRKKTTLTLHPPCFISFLVIHSSRQFPELRTRRKPPCPNRNLFEIIAVKGQGVVLLKSRFNFLIQYIRTYEMQTNT